MTQRNGDRPTHAETAPSKPEGWQSARELEKVYVGGSKDLNQTLATLRQALIGDIAQAVPCSVQEATAVVDAYLIGRKKPCRGPEALAASPDAERVLDLTTRVEAAPPKPEAWESAVELSRRFRGDHRTIGRQLERLRTELVMDLASAGFGDDASGLVENCLIGYKKPARGQETIAASPEAIRLAEDMGMITRRVQCR